MLKVWVHGATRQLCAENRPLLPAQDETQDAQEDLANSQGQVKPSHLLIIFEPARSNHGNALFIYLSADENYHTFALPILYI